MSTAMKQTEIRITRKKAGALHLAQSRPRQVTDGPFNVAATGNMLAFSVPVVEKGPRAGEPVPDGAQTLTMQVDTVDGVIVGPTGKNLARLVANNEITVSGARLPELGGWKSRETLLREQQGMAG